MSLRSLFEWVDALPSSIALRESLYGYPALLTTHVVSMCLFAGLVVMMDLRLLGVGNPQVPFTQVQKRFFPWQMFGFAVNLVTGLVLLYSQPMRYYGKVLFWTKFALMALAGVNAVYFHLSTYPSVTAWDTDVVLPSRARMAGFLSLALWAGVVVFGRLTAYNWLTYE